MQIKTILLKLRSLFFALAFLCGTMSHAQRMLAEWHVGIAARGTKGRFYSQIKNLPVAPTRVEPTFALGSFPGFGAIKMGIESGMTGRDLVTGDRLDPHMGSRGGAIALNLATALPFGAFGRAASAELKIGAMAEATAVKTAVTASAEVSAVKTATQLEFGFVNELGSVAKGIAIPSGRALQAATAEARTALVEIENGATVYRQGWTGTQRTFDAQNWALQNPATTPNFANQLGMPATVTESEYFWMMGGRVTPGAPVITRPAPGIGANMGGSMEAVVNPGGVRIDWFHMP